MSSPPRPALPARPATRDPHYEARRLRALLDGITMHGLWRGSPEDADQMLGTLSRHLDGLATPDV